MDNGDSSLLISIAKTSIIIIIIDDGYEFLLLIVVAIIKIDPQKFVLFVVHKPQILVPRLSLHDWWTKIYSSICGEK